MEVSINPVDIDVLYKMYKDKQKAEKAPSQTAGIVEVYDKYKSLTGYKVIVKTIKKGTITSIFKIGGRISKQDAYDLSEKEMERLKRKYRI